MILPSRLGSDVRVIYFHPVTSPTLRPRLPPSMSSLTQPCGLSSGILQQLMLCAGGESEMGSLLALMENAPFTQIGLKIDILKVR